MAENITVRSVSTKLRADFGEYLRATGDATAATAALRHEMDLLAKSAGSLDLPAKKAATAFEAEAAAAKKAGESGATAAAGVDKSTKAAKGLGDEVDKTAKVTGGFGVQLDNLAKNSESKFNKMLLGVVGVGAALLGVFGGAVAAGFKFDKEMSAVGSVLDTTGLSAKQAGQQLDELRQAAIKAGKDTVFSATEAAQAEEELAKAGVSTKDILGGALKGTLSLASAGTLDLGDAANYAAKAMNIFGLSGGNVGHIADVLSAGANKSAADVKDLADAMAQGGEVAHSTGLSLEDTVGVLSAFADHALVGSDAGTSLKSMFLALQNASGPASATMKELGISLYDQQGKFIGITALAGQLRSALGGLTQAQRDQALAQIFGSDATRAATVLYNEGAQGIRDYITAVNDQGAASDTAAKKLDNLSGDVEQLRGSLETLAISSDSGANAALRRLAQGANAVVGQFLNLPGPVQETLVVIAGIAGAGTLAATGFVKARQSGIEFLSTLRDMGPAGEKAATGLSKVAGFAGKAGLWGVAILGVYEGFRALGSWISSFSAPVARDVDAMTNSLQHFADTGQVTGEVAKTFGNDLAGLAKDIRAVTDANARLAAVNPVNGVSNPAFHAGGRGAGNAAQAAVAHATGDQAKQQRADLQALDESLASLVKGGNANVAAIAMDELAAKQHLSAEQTQALVDLLPQYKTASDNAALSNTGLAKGFASASAQAKVLSGSLEDAVAKGQTLDDVWKELNGAMLNSDQAMLDANNAISDVAKAFKENSNAINGNSDAALKDRVAVGQAAEAAAKAAQAKYEETGSVAQASKVYDDYIAALRRTLKQAGLTDAQINELLKAYASMPPSVTTSVLAPGATKSIDDGRILQGIYNDLNGRHVRVYIDESVRPGRYNTPVAQRWGGVHYAAAGLVNFGGAGIYSGGPVYGIAEPETGGEAFVPRYGDYSRSMGILREAAQWYGARVAPAGRGWDGAAAGGAVHHHYETTIQPKSVNFSPSDYRAIEQRNEVLSRIGRPG